MDAAAPINTPAEQKTPFELALDAFDRQAAVVNAQMAFMHAQILPPKHIGTTIEDIDNARDRMLEAYGNLLAIAENTGTAIPADRTDKLDMLNNSYALYRKITSAPSDAMVVSLT